MTHFEHPDIPEALEPTPRIEEIAGESTAQFDDADDYELPTELVEPVSAEDEELILEWYLEVQAREESLARVRASLLEAIKTLPQELPQTIENASQKTTHSDSSVETKKEQATPPPSRSENTPLF